MAEEPLGMRQKKSTYGQQQRKQQHNHTCFGGPTESWTPTFWMQAKCATAITISPKTCLSRSKDTTMNNNLLTHSAQASIELLTTVYVSNYCLNMKNFFTFLTPRTFFPPREHRKFKETKYSPNTQ